MNTNRTRSREGLSGFWSLLRAVPLFEVLVVFSLFPAVYQGAERLQPVEAFAPWNLYYLTIAAAAVCALGIFLLDRRIPPLSLFVLGVWLLFVGWAALSLEWTVGTDEYATSKLTRIAAFNTLLLVFGLALAQSRRRVVAFGIVMGLVGAWLTAEALYATYVLEEFPFVTTGATTYLSLGRAIGFAAPLLAYVLFAHRRYSLRVLAGALLAILLVGLLTTGARGPFVACAAALGVFVVIELVALPFHRQVSGRRVVFASVATAAVAGAVFAATQRLGGVPWTIRRLQGADGARNTDTRQAMIVEAYEFWQEEPIRGHGLGSYEAMSAVGHVYPHNVVAEILTELGLVGIGLFALLILPAFAMLVYVRFTTGDALHTALVALFVFMFVNASFSFDLQGNRQLFFAIGLMAFAWAEATTE